MNDDPITTSANAVSETAKAAGKALDLLRDAGSFVSRVLGTVPEDAVGFLGDYLREIRIRNIARLARRTDDILSQRGIKQSANVSPSLAIPLFESAQNEDRAELQELFARLLANAMDPARANDLRIEFIEAVRRFHPRDALILQKLAEASGSLSPNTRDYFVSYLKLSSAAVEVSIANLVETKCVAPQVVGQPSNFHLTSFGRELLAAARL
jgi:hypothetical protein